MRKLLIAASLVAAAAALGSCAPAPATPPISEDVSVNQQTVLGFDIRYVDADGHAKVLRVEDFPR